MERINELLGRATKYFLPESVTRRDDMERQRAELLVKMLLVLVFWGCFFSGLYYRAFDSLFGTAVCGAATIAMATSLGMMRMTGRVAATGNFMNICLYAAMVALAASNGGFAPPLSWLVQLPILALLFAGTFSALVWLGAIVGAFAFFHAATYFPGLTFPQMLSDGQLEVFHFFEYVALGIDVIVIILLKDGLQSWLMDNLRAREHRTNAILQTAPDGIIAVDADGRITEHNSAARQMFRSGDGLVDESIGDFVPELDSPDILANPEASTGLESTAHCPNGETFPAHIEIGTLQSESSDETILAVRDITDQKRRERKLREARDEAMEANRAKSVFLANMSHELRTPLNAVIGYSEMLINDGKRLDDDQSLEDVIPRDRLISDLDRVKTAGDQLLALVDDVLDLSKIEAGQIDTHYEAVDIAEMFEDLEGTLEPMAADNENDLVVEVGDGVGTMRTDRKKVRQILLNLASNACKFTERGTVRISASRPSETDGVAFEVADDGIGMSEEELDDIFQAFNQVDDSSTREYGGTGLGLAICRHFTELLGGQITVDSTPGEGTIFRVRLPDVDPSDELQDTPQLSDAIEDRSGTDPDDEASTAAAEGGESERAIEDKDLVLVVDDNPEVRDLLQRVLEREGFRTIEAADGEQGLELAREFEPIAITLDIKMPEMDGWTMLSELKDDQQLDSIPVVLVTMVDERSRGMALEADEYLTKPIDRERLVETLEQYRDPGDQSILLVEDDEPTRDLIRRTLDDAGWGVREARNGEEALEAVEESSPSLVLLDLMMPEMDGFEFLARTRLGDHPNLPVIVITAKELTQNDRQMLDGEVLDIVQKGGYDRDELLDQVQELVEQAVDESE